MPLAYPRVPVLRRGRRRPHVRIPREHKGDGSGGEGVYAIDHGGGPGPPIDLIAPFEQPPDIIRALSAGVVIAARVAIDARDVVAKGHSIYICLRQAKHGRGVLIHVEPVHAFGDRNICPENPAVPKIDQKGACRGLLCSLGRSAHTKDHHQGDQDCCHRCLDLTCRRKLLRFSAVL
ncbi:MAG: hypothetical protein A4E31_01347 [Methanomassiliicoccales archaeon PtaU1.Bin030]|nr:MAG: hypothetical protein A4E31_01347 [Methanomassiliicoccales archaeon PtaU1.Bin030]